MKRLGIILLVLGVVAGCSQAPATRGISGAIALPIQTRAVDTPVSGAGAAPAGQVPGTPGAATKLTLAMGYIPSVQFAPFYVAQQRGYFKDAGLDVTFQYGMESDLVKLVGANQLQFMIGSGEEVILGRSQGLPVRYIMRWYQHFPVVLFARADRGINTPKDLEGKTLGISALAGASYVGWRALAKGGGVDMGKVNVQVVGFTQAASVSQNRVDAALDYSVNGPVQMRLAGQPITVLPVSDYLDLPSNGLITNDQTLRDQPQVARALVAATLRGLKDTLADPDGAFAASLRAVPEAGGDQEKVNRAIFDESLKLWQVDAAKLGQSDPALWQKAATFMREVGLVDREVAPEELYSNDYLGGP